MKIIPLHFVSPFSFSRTGLRLALLLGLALATGCGGSPEQDSRADGGSANAVEAYTIATEKFGDLLAGVRSGEDVTRAKPELRRQAQAMVDAIAAMNTTGMENPRLSAEEKQAAIKPYRSRLEAAERQWRQEAKRVSATFGRETLDDISRILAQGR
jgi:hypothetical protein